MLKDKYMFPALFETGEVKGYTITFPDLPGCISEGNTLDEALIMAKEALELHLYGMEEDGDDIPEPTLPEKIKVPEDAFITLIEVYMPYVRDEMENKAVKKTLTIPRWLDKAATAKKINFSQVLQTSLKELLGINEKV